MRTFDTSTNANHTSPSLLYLDVAQHSNRGVGSGRRDDFCSQARELGVPEVTWFVYSSIQATRVVIVIFQTYYWHDRHDEAIRVRS